MGSIFQNIWNSYKLKTKEILLREIKKIYGGITCAHESEGLILLGCHFSLNWFIDLIQSQEKSNQVFFGKNWQMDSKILMEIQKTYSHQHDVGKEKQRRLTLSDLKLIIQLH